jgi:hypothetical protein
MLNKYSNIFRSRWKAVWWAAGVLLTAYCSIPSADQTASQAHAKHPHHQQVKLDAWGNPIVDHHWNHNDKHG